MFICSYVRVMGPRFVRDYAAGDGEARGSGRQIVARAMCETIISPDFRSFTKLVSTGL